MMVVVAYSEVEDAGGFYAAMRLIAERKAQVIIESGLAPHEAEVVMDYDFEGDTFRIAAVRR